MRVNYITDEVKAVIGAHNGPILAYHPVEASEVRRFFQAVMDPAPRYWDEAWAKISRYGGLVAPPAFPPLAFRRARSRSLRLGTSRRKNLVRGEAKGPIDR